MGSFTSRHNTNVIPQPLDVLPATESWSTLDAFQATVKSDGHHELINRSKTQKSLLRSNSFLKDNYKRRTKTLTKRVTNVPSSSSNADKKDVKAQLIASTHDASEDNDSIHPLPYSERRYSQSKLNARRPTHFYEVRQAMVNRLKFRKLESLISNDRIQNSEKLDESATRKEIIPVPEVADISAKTIAECEVNCNKDTCSTDFSKAASQPLAILEENVEEMHNKTSLKPIVSAFRVNPQPHATFLAESQLSNCELECQSIISELSVLSTEVSDRKDITQIMQQWKDSGQLASIETHALTVPQSQTGTLSLLADSLANTNAGYLKAVEGNTLHVQVAVAYCIYVWIANNITYDVEQWKHILSQDESSSTYNANPEKILQTRVTVSTGYANLFQALASICGLEVEVIHGHIKVWKCLSEENLAACTPFKPNRQNSHTWNSVVFGSIPYLLDCTFASGYVTREKKFCKSFNHNYFAVPPQLLILTHWPSHDSWQLLSKPLPLEKFQPLIPVSSKTIGLGIEPERWSEIVEIFDDPAVNIKLKCKDSLTLSATLVKNYESRYHGISTLSNNELTFIHREENTVSIKASLPCKGQYFLNVYACESFEGVPSQNHTLVLSYLIQNNKEIATEVGYPIVDHVASSTFNFKLLHWNAPKREYCCENSGKLDVVFQTQPNVQFYHYIVPGKTDGSTSPSTTEDKSVCHFNTLVVQNEVGDPSLYMLRAILPTHGWWSVYLYAKSPTIDANYESNQNTDFTFILRYNIYVQVGIPDHSYPNILSPVISVLYPESIFASGDEIYSFHFNSARKFIFHSYLTFGQQAGEAVDNCTIVEHLAHSSQYRLKVIFPSPGKWYVHIFGKDTEDKKKDSYSGLFILQIVVSAALKNTIFPNINHTLAHSLNVKHLDSESVIFKDDGSPFTYKFVIPKKSINLIHSIKPHLTGNTCTKFNKSLLQHCTSVLYDKHVGDFIPSEFTACSLNAVFPWAGLWTVQLFAASIGSNCYECLMEAKLHVSNPTPNVCYIKVHPSFYHLDISIPEKSLLYSPNTDKSEIEISFKAQDNLQFVWNMEYINNGEKYFHQTIIHCQRDLKPNNSDSMQDCVLQLLFPKPGDWLFQLYGRTRGKNLQEEAYTYQNVMEMRINTSSFNSELGFPHIFDPFENVFKMRLDKKQLPLVSKVSNLPSLISIPFYSPQNVKLWYDVEVNNSVTQPSSELKVLSENFYELRIEVNKKGKWTVVLYAQLIDSHRKNWTAVLKHTIISD